MTGKKIIIGVSGGIAAYKSAELIRLFKKAGAQVQVAMTHDAARFISPLTLGTLAESEVLTEIFPENEDGSWTKHVNLGLWADLFIVAPATAHTVSALAHGRCDSMLTAIALSARCPLLVCPSMDHDMFIHPATQRNLELLESYGYNVLEPSHGELASGLVGKGRLPEPIEIFEASAGLVRQATTGFLAGKKVLVTAGPTREAIDPVRFVSNRSTGAMGYEIAAAAAKLGADVCLVSGPTSLTPPDNVEIVQIESAADLAHAVQERSDADIVIMAAAVADFTPATVQDSKIKKQGSDDLSLSFKRTEDVLATLGKKKRANQMIIGFALETENGIENAKAKLLKKNLDFIILNNPKELGAGFGQGTNRVDIIDASGRIENLPLMSKTEVAFKIFDRVRVLSSNLS